MCKSLCAFQGIFLHDILDKFGAFWQVGAPLLKFRWAGMDSRLANRGSSCGATARGRSAHDPRCLGLPLLAAAAATLRAAFGRLSRCLLGSEAEVHWREFLSSLKARAAQLMTSVINF